MAQDGNADGTVETPSVEELQSRLAKAEAKVVELKKSSRDTTTNTSDNEETDTSETRDYSSPKETEILKVIEERDFFKANSELSGYKEEFQKFRNAGLEMDDIKDILMKKDPSIAARQKTNSMSITGANVSADKSSYTMDEITKIAGKDQRAYNQLMDKLDKGEITVK